MAKKKKSLDVNNKPQLLGYGDNDRDDKESDIRLDNVFGLKNILG